MSTPDFEAAYRANTIVDGQEGMPWNIGEPQPPLRALIDSGHIQGPVLDAGCGLAETALYCAARGFEAVGLDSSETAIKQARASAYERGLSVGIEVADITDFTGYDGRFRTIFDSTLFHSLPVEGRDGYLRSIARAAAPGAQLHMLVFNTEAQFPEDAGVPNKVTENELSEAVTQHWTIDSLQHSVITASFAPVEDDSVGRDARGRAQLPAFQLAAHLPE